MLPSHLKRIAEQINQLIVKAEQAGLKEHVKALDPIKRVPPQLQSIAK